MVEKSGTVEVRFYKESCVSPDGREGEWPTRGRSEARCLLNICIPRCRWKIFRCRLHRGGFIYIMHCPSSVSVCVLSTAHHPPFPRPRPRFDPREFSLFTSFSFASHPPLSCCRCSHVSCSLVITTGPHGRERPTPFSRRGEFFWKIRAADNSPRYRTRETGTRPSLLSLVSCDSSAARPD